ncbi:MAG: hypothetical protein D6760_00525 [Deltaproteobacteria bacterium]|nr:MAG: hypothetical protein D6760_00525 [Deltaproteobacteria bacterium]
MLSFPPDATFVVQFVSFFVLLALLNRWLFVPFLDLLEERRRRTQGALETAEADRGRAEEIRLQIENELAATRSEATGRAEEVRRRARDEEREIFAAAESQADARLEELRRAIARERAEAEQSLRAEAERLAERMVGILLEGGGRS